jgi:uncharacterized protein YlxW (UPF0749 family)
MSNYGLNFNAAFTQNENDCVLGVHVTDSEGLDLSIEETDTNELALITKVCNSITKDMRTISQARQLKAEKEAAEKAKVAKEEAETKRLKLVALKKQAEELQKEIDSMEKSVRSSNVSANTRKSVFDMSSEIDDIFKTFGAIFK